MRARPRNGLSLLEVVVLLACVALVAALMLPAMLSSRNGPRRNQCLNNMRNVGLAVQNFASQNNGRLPPLDDGRFGWPRSLLPLLDQPAIDRQIDRADWTDDQIPRLQVFTCPQDADSFRQPGGLSYVVNAGYGFFPVDRETGRVVEQGRHALAQDWDGDGEVSDEDRSVTKATGLFWRRDESVDPMTLDFIGEHDGTGTTLLITENLQAGPWTTRDARALAVVIGRERLAFDRAAGPLAVTAADLGPFAANAARAGVGPVPAPSSSHAGSFSVIWADGHGGGVSETIDPIVYARLLTPAGQSYGQPPVDENTF